MKRRVGTVLIYSESGMVEDRYDSFTEEQLGVSNRNRKRVELDGSYRYRRNSIESYDSVLIE